MVDDSKFRLGIDGFPPIGFESCGVLVDKETIDRSYNNTVKMLDRFDTFGSATISFYPKCKCGMMAYHMFDWFEFICWRCHEIERMKNELFGFVK